jgi:UDP-glucose 4-epimerase
MGMSKALMEKVAVAKARTIGSGKGPVICVTRYGNVMASRGSVIPLFRDQIKAGRPLTLTDPDMTRFMMSLDDAVDLVLFAFKNGVGGDTFVQKAPAATIKVLAEAVKALFKADTEIKVIGTRHGEKKHETLLNREELVHAEDLKDYYRVPSDTRDLNYGKYFEQGEGKVSIEEDYTSGNTRRLDKDEMIKMLMKLEYIQEELAGG